MVVALQREAPNSKATIRSVDWTEGDARGMAKHMRCRCIVSRGGFNFRAKNENADADGKTGY